jgi:GAF domain-containing protein
LEQGADDYLTKPFSARELIARIRVNIKLSYLRKQLYLQQKRQVETKQLLFSISSKIRSRLNIQETLSTAVEEVHNILPCDRIYIITTEDGDSRLSAYSATDKNERNLRGELVCFTVEENNLTESSNKTNLESCNTSDESIQQAIKNNDDIKELEVTVLPNYYSHVVQRQVSLIALQIKINSKTWGWLVANRAPNKTWLDSERMFLQQILNQISLAVTHSILLEEKLKKEAQMEAARAANEAKSQILANTSHGSYFYLLFSFFFLI